MNLFLISGLGQLFHAQSLIVDHNLAANGLAILYTDRNVEILSQIEENVNEELFEIVKYVKLPDYPLKKTRKNQMEIKRCYTAILQELKPSTLFVCSYEHHYNLILEMARDQGVKLKLFEEGTATYKDLIPNEWSRWKSLRAAFARLVKDLFVAVLRFVSSIFSEKEKYFIRKIFIGKELQSVFNAFKDFDEVYVVFPEKAKLIFNAKRYNQINTSYKVNEESAILLKGNNIIQEIDPSNSILFVNQRYNVPNQIHIETIYNFMERHFPDNKIFFKFHPRDSVQTKQEIISIIAEKRLPINVIDMDYEVPVETIISFRKPKYLIGISSSSLAYIQKKNEEVTVLSCANFYIKSISKYNEINRKVIDEIEYHKKILASLSDIEIM